VTRITRSCDFTVMFVQQWKYHDANSPAARRIVDIFQALAR